MESLAEAVDAVICEVALTDEKHGKTPEEVDSRKRFVAGASMGVLLVAFSPRRAQDCSDALDSLLSRRLGGFTALLYAM